MDDGMSSHYNNDQRLMDGEQCQYIPFAVGLYMESNNWSWKPHRKETLFGRVIFNGQNHYGFRRPEWVVNGEGIIDGLLFYTVLCFVLFLLWRIIDLK